MKPPAFDYHDPRSKGEALRLLSAERNAMLLAGGQSLMVDTIAGHVAANFPTIISGLGNVRAGKLRALGVTSLQRSPLLPEVPTIAEQGFPAYEVNAWYGWLAPAGTPRQVIALLNAEATKAIKTPEVRERLASDGAVPIGSTPDEFARHIRSEMEKWGKVVKQAGITAD